MVEALTELYYGSILLNTYTFNRLQNTFEIWCKTPWHTRLKIEPSTKVNVGILRNMIDGVMNADLQTIHGIKSVEWQELDNVCVLMDGLKPTRGVWNSQAIRTHICECIKFNDSPLKILGQTTSAVLKQALQMMIDDKALKVQKIVDKVKDVYWKCNPNIVPDVKHLLEIFELHYNNGNINQVQGKSLLQVIKHLTPAMANHVFTVIHETLDSVVAHPMTPMANQVFQALLLKIGMGVVYSRELENECKCSLVLTWVTQAAYTKQDPMIRFKMVDQVVNIIDGLVQSQGLTCKQLLKVLTQMMKCDIENGQGHECATRSICNLARTVTVAMNEAKYHKFEDWLFVETLMEWLHLIWAPKNTWRIVHETFRVQQGLDCTTNVCFVAQIFKYFSQSQGGVPQPFVNMFGKVLGIVNWKYNNVIKV